MNIYDQLQAVEDRYEELGELLSDPEVVSDTKRFMELSREEANTRETVTAYREYKQVIQSISDAEEMIKEASGDADLEEMVMRLPCLQVTFYLCIKNTRKHKVGALMSWKPLIMVSVVSKKWLPWFQANQSTLNSNMNQEHTVCNVCL